MHDQGGVRGAGRSPAGFTLVEVVVVLALLGLILGLSALSLASLKSPPESAELRQLDSARRAAIVTGTPARTGMNHAPRTTYLFLPDARALGPNIDPLTGGHLHAVR